MSNRMEQINNLEMCCLTLECYNSRFCKIANGLYFCIFVIDNLISMLFRNIRIE